MFKSLIKEYSIVRGALRAPELGYIAFGKDSLMREKQEHSFFLVYHQGSWLWPTKDDSVVWTTTSATVVSTPKLQALFMGLFGEIFRVGSGDVAQELTLRDLADGPGSFGPMRCIRAIAGRAYAVGMGRQAYCRVDQDQWERIDQTCRTPLTSNETFSFEAIHGLSETALFASGRRGEIWAYDGHRWTQEDSPTNRILTDILVRADGSVLACGLDGVILERDSTGWRVVEGLVTADDFWGLCEFQGRAFISSFRDVYEYSDRVISKVDFGRDSPGSCFGLSITSNSMWSIGSKDIFSFDGSVWTRVV